MNSLKLPSSRLLTSPCTRLLPALLALLLCLSLSGSAHAAIFPVTTTADSGVGSLRQAVIGANLLAGPDTITFAIGSGAQTIILNTPLQDLSETVTIDGTSQPGFAGTPLITLLWGPNNVGNGLTITADHCLIKDLIVLGFDD